MCWPARARPRDPAWPAGIRAEEPMLLIFTSQQPKAARYSHMRWLELGRRDAGDARRDAGRRACTCCLQLYHGAAADLGLHFHRAGRPVPLSWYGASFSASRSRTTCATMVSVLPVHRRPAAPAQPPAAIGRCARVGAGLTRRNLAALDANASATCRCSRAGARPNELRHDPKPRSAWSGGCRTGKRPTFG
ncbi:hypothetical protein SSTU70S_00683 [Stutzerimonas stutzeri]